MVCSPTSVMACSRRRSRLKARPTNKLGASMCPASSTQPFERRAPGIDFVEPTRPAENIFVAVDRHLRLVGERHDRGCAKVGVGQPVFDQLAARGQDVVEHLGVPMEVVFRAFDGARVGRQTKVFRLDNVFEIIRGAHRGEMILAPAHPSDRLGQ